jgi:YHS domain-containing protein
MRFLLEIIPYIFLFLLLRSGIRSYLANSRRNREVPRSGQDPSAAPAAAELMKDPVCGTYVSPAAGVSRTVNGQLIYFCSKECSDKYAG